MHLCGGVLVVHAAHAGLVPGGGDWGRITGQYSLWYDLDPAPGRSSRRKARKDPASPSTQGPRSAAHSVSLRGRGRGQIAGQRNNRGPGSGSPLPPPTPDRCPPVEEQPVLFIARDTPNVKTPFGSFGAISSYYHPGLLLTEDQPEF